MLFLALLSLTYSTWDPHCSTQESHSSSSCGGWTHWLWCGSTLALEEGLRITTVFVLESGCGCGMGWVEGGAPGFSSLLATWRHGDFNASPYLVEEGA